MPGRHLLPSLLAAAVFGAACQFACAADDLTPRPQRTFTEKPRIEDYADYNAFLVDIMEYRRQKQERVPRAGATGGNTTALTVAPAALNDQTLATVSGQDSTALRELYEIREPESLEEALDRARKLPHPVYSEAERFGRTTSSSFPMPQLESEELATGGVSGILQDLESVTPDVFKDPGADDQAARTLATNPGNDDEQRDTKATEGALAAYKIAYDFTSRMVTDSDGKKLWVPQFLDAEYGQTIITKLNIDVGVHHSN